MSKLVSIRHQNSCFILKGEKSNFIKVEDLKNPNSKHGGVESGVKSETKFSIPSYFVNFIKLSISAQFTICHEFVNLYNFFPLFFIINETYNQRRLK